VITKHCDRCGAQIGEDAARIEFSKGYTGYRQTVELCEVCREDLERFWPNVRWAYRDGQPS
jgi:hypothetical protein